MWGLCGKGSLNGGKVMIQVFDGVVNMNVF